MKSIKFLLVIFVTIIVSFSLTFLFYSFYIIQEVQELDMKMKVGDVIGIDVNSTAISFGTVRMNSSSRRPVTLENKRDYALKVHIKKSGEMAEWVSVSDNDFVLQPSEKKELFFKAIHPTGVENGAYKGKVKIIFTRDI